MWVIILFKRFTFFLALLLLVPQAAYASEVSAESAIVMDMETHTVLYERNAYAPRPMASTTKIMTALLACESGRLEESFSVTGEMLAQAEGSLLGLRAGDQLTLYDLVVGMLLVSGNDAANVTACCLSGSIDAFAEQMNRRAADIGMKDTVFVTPSGLDSGNHHSTAYDMALMTAAALENKTFAEICAMQRADIHINGKQQTVYNHNKLLASLKDCVGVKTGYTEKAGRCLVSALTYKGNTMICVTLSAPDDWADHTALFKTCKKKYQTKHFSRSLQIPVAGGLQDAVMASYDYSTTSLQTDFSVRYYYYPFIYAPVQTGDIIGYAKINHKSVPIKAQEDVQKYGTEQ